MKKTGLLLMSLVFILATISSCKKEETTVTPPDNYKLIQGNWGWSKLMRNDTLVPGSDDACSKKTSLNFTSDLNYAGYFFSKNVNDSCVALPTYGTYEISTTTLTTTPDTSLGTSKQVFSIQKLNSTDLEMKIGADVYFLKKN